MHAQRRYTLLYGFAYMPHTSTAELRPQPVTTSPLLLTVSSNSDGSNGSLVTWKRVVPAPAWNHLHHSKGPKGGIHQEDIQKLKGLATERNIEGHPGTLVRQKEPE